MVLFALNPNTSKAEAGNLCEMKANLVYVVSSRLAIVIQSDPASEKQNEKQKTMSKDRCLKCA